MSTAYIDTSVLIAIETCQPDSDAYEEELGRFEWLVSSNLLEAEYRSVCMREKRAPSNFRLNKISWIIPTRPLTRELESVMTAGYLRGADLWHVATAIYAEKISMTKMSFLTLDNRQRYVANTVGFGVRPEIFGMTRD